MAVGGAGAPVTTREALTLRDTEYLPDENAVRYVVAENDDGPVERTTEPVARYAHRQCVKAGVEAVLRTIEDRFGSPPEHVSAEARFEDDGGRSERVVVEYTVWMDGWKRTVRGTPNIDFDELVAVTPRSVRATVELAGEEYSREVSVFVRATEAALL